MSVTFTAEELLHQAKLHAHLNSVFKAKGKLPFAEFMQIVLYEPGLGYYSAGKQKLGSGGDFVTAPMISPLFSQALANQCMEILSHLDAPIILELGAGHGQMACDLMLHLAQHQALPEQYFILEVSGDLKARQQQTVKATCPELFHRFVWLDRLPEKTFNGIILGNEVLDALPVHLFQIGENDAILEGFVQHDHEQFSLVFDKASTEVIQKVKKIQKQHHLAQGYTSEVNLLIKPLLASLNAILHEGVMLWIDYGFPQHEYYHPSRSGGTLMCHLKHQAHTNPLIHIGLQDITAHVDFTDVAQSAHELGLSVLGFTNQAAFLLANGILELATSSSTPPFKLSQQIQQLTQTHEMGELFKVIALSKNFDFDLQGFMLKDHRHRL